VKKPQQNIDAILNIFSKADEAAMEVYNSSDFGTEYKEDNSPITRADIAVNTIVIAGLNSLYPSIPIVSEEGDVDGNLEILNEAERFFLLDPIDGTKEFIKRTGDFCIGLGLIERDIPTLGVVTVPATGAQYWGSLANGGYMRNRSDQSERIEVSKSNVGKVVVSRQVLDKDTEQYIKDNYPAHEIVPVGSMLKQLHVATGRADVYPRLASPLHSWDLAAGHAIIRSTGGTVTTIEGRQIDYRRRDFLVGDFVAKRKPATC